MRRLTLCCTVLIFLVFSTATATPIETLLEHSENWDEPNVSSQGSNQPYIITPTNPEDIQSWQPFLEEPTPELSRQLREYLINSIGENQVRRKLQSNYAFSANLSAAEREAAENTELVAYIEPDLELTTFLSETTGIVESDTTNQIRLGNQYLDGAGETVCVIDTGVDYTHPDLGGCTLANPSPETYALAPYNTTPYPDNANDTYTVTRTGWDSISVYFAEVDTEPTNSTLKDYIEITDGNGSFVEYIYGSKTGVWSKRVSGDTINVRFVSNNETNGSAGYSGFNITQIREAASKYERCPTVIGGYDFVNNDEDAIDDEGHGTHVAGTIAGNGSYVGVAPGSSIYAVKALDAAGSGSFSDIVAGVEHCTDAADEHNISVISMSLGASVRYSEHCDLGVTRSAVQAAVNKNISVVIASGNNGVNNEISYPSCIQEAIPVGATDNDDSIASYSNRDDILDVMAPGTGVTATQNGGGYTTKSGTSMATPHVSAAIAILNQNLHVLNQDRTPSELETLLINTGATVTDGGTGYNYSRINVYDAVLELNDFKIQQSEISFTPRYANENSSVNITVNASNNTFLDAIRIGNASFTKNGDLFTYETNVSALNLSEGNNTLTLNAFNAANQTALTNTSYYVDNHAPNITAQTQITTRHNTSTNLTITVTDHVPIQTVTANNQTLTSNTTNYTYTATFTADTCTENCTVNITAEDAARNTANTTITVLIDNEAPNISAVTPQNNSSVNTYRTTVNATIHDESNTTCTATYQNQTAALGNTVATPNESANITITCVDTAGNTATTNTTFRTDFVPPTTNATIQSLSTDPEELVLNASDNHGVNKTMWRTTQTSWKPYTAPVTINNTTTISYYSVDNAGNREPTKTTRFTRDQTPPNITVLAPREAPPNTAITIRIHTEHEFNATFNNQTKNATPATITTPGTPGAYKVVVQAKDEAGNNASTTKNITVTPQPTHEVSETNNTVTNGSVTVTTYNTENTETQYCGTTQNTTQNTVQLTCNQTGQQQLLLTQRSDNTTKNTTYTYVVDRTPPTIHDATINVTGATRYTPNITEANLAAVTVNNITKTTQYTFTITPSQDTAEIVAADEAGNTARKTVNITENNASTTKNTKGNPVGSAAYITAADVENTSVSHLLSHIAGVNTSNITFQPVNPATTVLDNVIGAIDIQTNTAGTAQNYVLLPVTTNETVKAYADHGTGFQATSITYVDTVTVKEQDFKRYRIDTDRYSTFVWGYDDRESEPMQEDESSDESNDDSGGSTGGGGSTPGSGGGGFGGISLHNDETEGEDSEVIPARELQTQTSSGLSIRYEANSSNQVLVEQIRTEDTTTYVFTSNLEMYNVTFTEENMTAYQGLRELGNTPLAINLRGDAEITLIQRKRPRVEVAQTEQRVENILEPYQAPFKKITATLIIALLGVLIAVLHQEHRIYRDNEE